VPVGFFFLFSPSPFMERGPGGEVFAAPFLAGGAAFFAGAFTGFGESPPKGSLPRTLRAIGMNRS